MIKKPFWLRKGARVKFIGDETKIGTMLTVKSARPLKTKWSGESKEIIWLVNVTGGRLSRFVTQEVYSTSIEVWDLLEDMVGKAQS